MKKRSLSLWQVIALAVIVGQLIPVVLSSWQTLDKQRETLMRSMQNEHERLATVLSIGVAKALWDLDTTGIKVLFDAVAADERVTSLTLNGIPEHDKVYGPLPSISHPERKRGKLVTVTKTMYRQQHVLGTLTLEMDTWRLEQQLSADFRHFLAVVSAQLAFSLLLTIIVLNKRFLKPVHRLMSESAMLAGRKLDQPFDWQRGDELGDLGRSLEETRKSLRTAFGDIEESEQRFRSLTGLSSDWYWESNAAGQLSLLSQGFKDITGIDPEAMLGDADGARRLFHYTEQAWEEYRTRVKARQPFRDLEWHVERPDGQIRYGIISGEPVFGADDEFRGYRGIGKDVTAAKLAEAAQSSAVRLRMLVEHLPGSAIHIEDGRMRMNVAAEALTGFTRDEITDLNQWFGLLFGDEAARMRAIYEAAKRSGFENRVEFEIVRKDGARRIVEFAAYRDDGNEVWLLHDITQREEAKAALQQTLLEFQAILDNASLGVTFTRHRAFLHCNERFSEMFGWANNELIGQQTHIIYPSEEAFDMLSRTAIPTLSEGKRLDVELQMKRKDGSLFWCRMLARAIDPSDIAKGSIFITEDITERRQTEDALRQTLLEQQAILDNSAIGIAFVMDRTILRANVGLEKLLGYAAAEMIGKSTRIWYDSEDTYLGIGEDLYSVTLANGVFSRDLQLVRKDGSRVWCNMTSKAVHEGQRANITLIQDITERKSAETALIEAKNNVERSLKEIEHTRHEISLLGELTSFLQACPTADDAYIAIRKYAPRLFPHGGGALYLIEDGSELLDNKVGWGEIHSLPRFMADQCWALRRGQPFSMERPSESLCCGHIDGEDLDHPYACIPLTAQGKIFGLLFIEFPHASDGRLADARQRLATALAEQCGLALANLRLRDTLRQQSIRDPLTGLYNRRHMGEVLHRELARAARNRAELAVLIIDVDHFKKFNDTYGHDAGDHVLQCVARVLEQRVRQSDVVCRLGGEEFVVVLPDANRDNAVMRAKDLLDGIRGLKLKHGNRSLGTITASLGIAMFPDHGATGDGLIEVADEALYLAKESGRNQAVLAKEAA